MYQDGSRIAYPPMQYSKPCALSKSSGMTVARNVRRVLLRAGSAMGVAHKGGPVGWTGPWGETDPLGDGSASELIQPTEMSHINGRLASQNLQKTTFDHSTAGSESSSPSFQRNSNDVDSCRKIALSH